MMGPFFNTCFLTMIWCSKHFQGMYFHPPLLTWKYLENSWKFFFLKFCHFFKFYSFLRIFSLLNYVPKNDSKKNWTEVSSNESNKFWTDYRKYFSESYLWKNRFIRRYFCSIFVRVIFCTWLVRKIYVKWVKFEKMTKFQEKKISWILEIFSCE